MLDVPLIVEAALQNDWSHIVNLGYLDESWNEPHQFGVIGIIVPTQDGQAVLRLELVAIG